MTKSRVGELKRVRVRSISWGSKILASRLKITISLSNTFILLTQSTNDCIFSSGQAISPKNIIIESSYENISFKIYFFFPDFAVEIVLRYFILKNASLPTIT